MADLSLAAAVTAVVIEYQSARDLMQSIRLLDNHWQKHHLTAEKELRLMDALNSGDKDLSQRYNAIYRELGEQYRIGDGLSQQKLSQIAQLIQARITKDLQMAVKFDDAQIDYPRITQDAVLFRRAALGVLEELRKLFLPEKLTADSLVADPSNSMVLETHHGSIEQSRCQEFMTPESPKTDQHPVRASVDTERHSLAVKAPKDRPVQQRAKIMRLFSKRKSRMPEDFSGVAADLAVSEQPDRQGSDSLVPHERERALLKISGKGSRGSAEVPVVLDVSSVEKSRESTTLGAWDKWRQPEQEICSHQPGYRDRPVFSSWSIPEHPAERGNRTDSVASDASSSEEAGSSSNGNSTPLTSPASERSSADWSAVHSPPLSFCQKDDVCQAPAIPAKSPLRSLRHHQRSVSTNDAMTTLPELAPSSMQHYRSASTAVVARPVLPDCSSESLVLKGTLSRPMSLLEMPTEFSGVTELDDYKDSDRGVLCDHKDFYEGELDDQKGFYQGELDDHKGFCQGALAARDSSTTNLGMRPSLDGTGDASFLRCRHCSFQSPLVTKDDYCLGLDEKVYSKGGILYRHAFLIKSHLSCSTPSESSFGCNFCGEERKAHNVYDDFDALLEHIIAHHAKEMSDKVAKKNRCIRGRVAKSREKFDICIPACTPKRRQYAPVMPTGMGTFGIA